MMYVVVGPGSMYYREPTFATLAEAIAFAESTMPAERVLCIADDGGTSIAWSK